MGRTGVGTLCLWLCAVVCLAHGQTYVNVARDKTYRQSSHLASQGPSSNAANGDTSGIYPTNGIHTLVGNGDWWEVDLGETYAVHSITVWARTGFKQRLYPSKITVDGQTCASITTFPTDTREKTVTCSSVMYGRKVRITRQPTPQQLGVDRTLNLCEMQIWGCVSGRYGDQCSTDCSPGCQDTSCDPQSGHCSCKTGYTGDKCAGCVVRHYGALCNRSCLPANCLRCHQDTGVCTGCEVDSNLQPPDCKDCHDGYYKRLDNTGCDACRGTCQSGTVCDKTTGFCPLCPPGKQGLYCEQACQDGWYGNNCRLQCGSCLNGDACNKSTGHCSCAKGKQPPFCSTVKKDNDETVNTSVIVGAVVGLFIGICIIVLAVVLWALRSRRTSRQSRTTTDNPEVTTSPASARPADRGKANAVFHGVTDEEEHYESVGDIPMTTKHAHPESSTHPDTTTCLYPGTSTHPDTMSYVTGADSPYDLPAEQYSNTGEVHLYDPWRVSRATQPDDDINMTAHSADKGKVPGEKGNDYENPN